MGRLSNIQNYYYTEKENPSKSWEKIIKVSKRNFERKNWEIKIWKFFKKNFWEKFEKTPEKILLTKKKNIFHSEIKKKLRDFYKREITKKKNQENENRT